jgi:O-antigen/teichoic acid export membrane protein
MIKKRKLISNSLSMAANSFTQSVSTFVLCAAIARLLGSKELGQYLLAFSYYFIVVTIVSNGLKTLFVRKLALTPEEIPEHLVNGTIIQLFLGIVGFLGLVAIVFLFPYNADTKMVCYLMGLTIVPFSLSNITEAIFQAQERMHLIAFATVPVYLIRLIIAIWVMNLGYQIDAVIGIFVLSEFLILIVQWCLLLPTIELKFKLDRNFMWRTLKSASTFFAIDGASILSTRLEILVLSLVGSEFLVGLYGGILQIMQPFFIIANSVSLSIFPSLSKAVEIGREKQRQFSENIIEMLMLLALPFLIGLCFIGENLLTLIYGNDSGFNGTHTALVILALSLIVYPFIRPLSYVLVANGLERINLYEVISTTILKGLLGIILVSQFQLNGAAMTNSAIAVISFSWYIYGIYRYLFSLRWWQIFIRPLLLSSIMLAIFVLLQKIGVSFIETLGIATFTYFLLVCLISIYTFGGPRKVWMRLIKKNLE